MNVADLRGLFFLDTNVFVTECSTLLSEDLQHKQKVRTLTILNPFV